MRHLFLASLGLSIAAGPVCADVAIYSQRPWPAAEDYPGYSIADYVPPPNEQYLAEGFEVPQASTISSISFWGKNPRPSNPIQGFHIRVWNADGVSSNGVAQSPGTILFSQYVAWGSPNFTHTSWPESEPLEFADQYDIELETTLELAPDTRYYFAVASLGHWGWGESQDTMHIAAYYNIFSFDSWYTFEPPFGPLTGRAFELRGVPTPGGLSAILAAGVWVSRRRR